MGQLDTHGKEGGSPENAVVNGDKRRDSSPLPATAAKDDP